MEKPLIFTGICLRIFNWILDWVNIIKIDAENSPKISTEQCVEMLKRWINSKELPEWNKIWYEIDDHIIIIYYKIIAFPLRKL